MMSLACAALRQRRGGVARQGTRSSPLSVQGLREDIRLGEISRARRCRACTERWLAFGASPQARRSERLPALRGLRRARRIAGVTASWRRVRQAPVSGLPGSARRTRPSLSRAGRGSGSWIAKPRRRGGKARKRGLSREQVPILVAAGSRRRDPQPHLARPQRKEREGGAGAGRRPRCLARLRRQPLLSACRSGAGHPSTRASTAPPASGFAAPCTSRRVNSRHSQIKGFLRGFRGIATKYLDSYLRWFHLIELGDQPSPRACLKAAMARPCLRFAN